jgi:hypothetical protein
VSQKYDGRGTGWSPDRAFKNQHRLSAGLTTPIVAQSASSEFGKLATFARRIADTTDGDYHSGLRIVAIEAHAARERMNLMTWRDEALRRLRVRRDNALDVYHRSRIAIRECGLDTHAGQVTADVNDYYERAYQSFDSEIVGLATASFAMLRALRAAQEGARV